MSDVATDQPLEPPRAHAKVVYLGPGAPHWEIHSEFGERQIVDDAQNLGFSIAIDRARPIIEQLQRGEGAVTPDQAFLGVTTADVSSLTDAQRERFEVDADEGALVTEVVPGSAAEEAGIEEGDVIVGIDGDGIEQATEVRAAIIDRDPGDRIELQVERAGEERTVEVTLGRRGDRT